MSTDRLLTCEFFEIVSVMLGRFHQQFHVIDGVFQLRTETSKPAIEIVIWKQAKNGDAQPASRGNQCFRNTAADFRWSELIVTDEIE